MIQSQEKRQSMEDGLDVGILSQGTIVAIHCKVMENLLIINETGKFSKEKYFLKLNENSRIE